LSSLLNALDLAWQSKIGVVSSAADFVEPLHSFQSAWRFPKAAGDDNVVPEPPGNPDEAFQ